MLKQILVSVGAMVALGAATATQAADITGAGSTFAAPIYGKWGEAYKAKTGIALNYQPIGSGGGIKQIEAKTVEFGATDMPLSEADLAANDLSQFPTVTGGVVPVMNLPGSRRWPAQADRRAAGRHLSGRDHHVERSAHHGGQQGRQPSGPCRSRSCTVRTARAPPSYSRPTCR